MGALAIALESSVLGVERSRVFTSQSCKGGRGREEDWGEGGGGGSVDKGGV